MTPASVYSRPRFIHSQPLFWVLLLAALLPWFYFTVQMAMNFDIAWLTDALQRVFAGNRMAQSAYEINPPLSLFLYALPVLASQWLFIPLHYAVLAQSVCIIIFATVATAKILTAWNIHTKENILIVVAGLLLVNTIMAGKDFGERDHLIGACLLPLTLLQIGITYKLPRPGRWFGPILIAGTLAVLIKPHYGLLPVILLLHRMIFRKNFSALEDYDLICLGIGTVIYLNLIVAIFPDYLTVILPDAIKLYALNPAINKLYVKGVSCLLSITLLTAFITRVPARPQERKLAFLFLISAIICLIAYFAQGRGFTYHLLPALSFIVPALGLALIYRLRLRYTATASLNISLSVLIILAFLYTPLPLSYPRHRDYVDLPLSEILHQKCPRNKKCSFFMYNNMSIMHETAYYTDTIFASRFPTLWFLPTLMKAQQHQAKGLPTTLSKRETEFLYTKYAYMVTEDLSIYKPDIIFLLRRPNEETSLYLDFMMPYLPFTKEWDHYKQIETAQLAYWKYYGGDKKIPATFDVYIRQ